MIYRIILVNQLIALFGLKHIKWLTGNLSSSLIHLQPWSIHKENGWLQTLKKVVYLFIYFFKTVL